MDEATPAIIACGFSPRHYTAFEMVLKGPGKGKFHLVNGEPPDVGVVDIDGESGMAAWDRFRKDYPDLPAVILSVTPPQVADASFVSKPVRVDELLKALRLTLKSPRVYRSTAREGGAYRGSTSQEKAAATPHADNGATTVPKPEATPTAESADGRPHLRLSPLAETRIEPPELPAAADDDQTKQAFADSTPAEATDLFDDKRPALAASLVVDKASVEETCGHAEDIDLDDAAALGTRTWSGQGFLEGYAREAVHMLRERRCPVELAGLPRPMFFLPDGRVYVGHSDRALRSLCVVHVNQRITRVDPVDSGRVQRTVRENSVSYRTQDIESVLWNISLWTARGRLPAGTDVHQQAQLRRWPNLTRNLQIPYAMPIAALWHQSPHSIAEICTILDIPQRFVFSFYSAARGIGILNAVSGSTAAAPARPVAVARESLLRRIFKRIGF